MSTKLYVGNLSKSVGPKRLAKEFAACGTVVSLKLVTDRKTGRSKGFAFVEMSGEKAAEEAIQKLNGESIDERPIEVSVAKPHSADAKPVRGSVKGQRTHPRHRDPGESRVRYWE
ncbi:MAG: RNA recognition motif domain-containing protein [Gammaproteobacteria bacterium]